MTIAFVLVVAVLTTALTIPMLSRIAIAFSLVDYPSERKVHTSPIPRCGGLGIFIGTTAGALIWLNPDPEMVAYLLAALILVIFGIWDDRSDLDYRVKLTGQALAAVIVMIGGNYFYHVPFWSIEQAPSVLTLPFTFLFIVGLTNAINLTDGLDGLASGCSLVTLGMLALMAYPMGEGRTLIVAFALIGAILGFLRFNSHPATIFLGDTGSQFLGFSIAVVAVQLIDQVYTTLSPSLIFLLVGLPILDTLWVMADRITRGRSPFRPDKRHFHHRLLSLGFQHYQAVGLIYILHIALAGSAYFLAYYPDYVHILIFCIVGLVTIGTCTVLEKIGWSADRSVAMRLMRDIKQWGRTHLSNVAEIPLQGLAVMLSLTILAGSVAVATPSFEICMLSLGLLAVYVLACILARGQTRFPCRLGIFLTGALLVYLLNDGAVDRIPEFAIDASFWLLFLLTIAAFYFVPPRSFLLTGTDVLILFLAVFIPIVSELTLGDLRLAEAAVQLVIFFYATEFLMFAAEGSHRPKYGHMLPSVSVAVALVILSLRGLPFG